MAPWLDQILVGLLIAAAVGFFVRQAWRRKKGDCNAGCCPGRKAHPPEK